MSAEYQWEHVKSIMAADQNGNAYQIEKEQLFGTVRPISGNGHTNPVGGKIRFVCDGKLVNPLPNGQFKLQSGLTVTAEMDEENITHKIE